MKIKKKTNNKGQVHPFSTSSSATTTTRASEFLSVLQLLPATILTLTSFLSLDDREVLAYMITLSLKTSSTNKHLAKKNSPMFECDCFQCYTSYWFRWDSSPNRELIHQAIEAFEEHLAIGEQQQRRQQQQQSKKKNCNKSRKRDKKKAAGDAVVFMHDTMLSGVGGECEVVEPTVGLSEKDDVAVVEDDVAGVVVGGSSHKGLARKVLPDVLGIFSSRLWSLWGPNV